MKKYINTDKIVFNKFVLIFVLLFFVVVVYRMGVLSLFNTIDGINLQEFASNRNTRKTTLHAQRGSIYDSNGDILAQTINSYTVVAFLDSSRSEGYSTPRHVVDKKNTAKELSKIINMSEESILLLLNRDVYQVELGPGGRGITELTKERIEELNLPGISFMSSYKRYYPNGEFLSYVIGYTQANNDNEIKGEMGIELGYDNELKGKDGYSMYQQDLYGYKIPNTPEITEESVDGVDIYLTIDSNIQFSAERITKEAYEKYSPDWAITTVTDAQTGAILASTSYPSFDPNKKDMTNYLNPLVSYVYEPGSTMKTYTYMSVMESGKYNGNETFKSGSISFGSDIISDWKTSGWGTITYDEGFTLSANTGISNLVKKYSSAGELREYFEKMGFGEKTGIELPNELSGQLKFKYPVEVATAGFGQGITTTAIQNIQALTAIANNGTLLKPYIVKKIVDTNTNKTTYKGERTEIRNVASTSTINKIKELMYQTVNGDASKVTGSIYKINGYDVIGKTGTAQYTDPNTGKYYYDEINYIRSFAGMFPKDNPKYIIYVVMKRNIGGNTALSNIVKPLMKDIVNYKGMFQSKEDKIQSFEMPNLLNKTVDYALDYLKDKTDDIVVVGKGDKIINQYPYKSTTLNLLDKIYLITNSSEFDIPNIKGWSLKETNTLCNLINYKLEYDGTGFVTDYEVNKDSKKIIISLLNDIKEDEKIEGECKNFCVKLPNYGNKDLRG